MSSPTGSCCGAAAEEAASGISPFRLTSATCRACGMSGTAVEHRTILHMLRPDRIDDIGERTYRFCATANCETVYFSTDAASKFTTADLREPVGVKMGGDRSAPVCYCFGIIAGDLADEITGCGTTEIPGRIRELVKGRMCACEVRNPSGRCCLGEIARVVERLAVFEPRAGGRSIDGNTLVGYSKEDV